MNRSSRVKTPENSHKEISRLKKEGKPYKEIVAALDKGGFKTASGSPWTVSNVQNQLKYLGLVKSERHSARRVGSEIAAKDVKGWAVKTTTLSLKKSKTINRFMTAMLRIPVEINLGTTEFRVLSLDK